MPEMEPSRKKLAMLARLIANTTPVEIDCGEVLDRVAPYLERCQEKLDLSPELDKVKQHLSVCPECLEEFEALEKLYEDEASQN